MPSSDNKNNKRIRYVRLTCPLLRQGTIRTMLQAAPRLLRETARRRQELTGLLLYIAPEGRIHLWERTEAAATENMGSSSSFLLVFAKKPPW